MMCNPRSQFRIILGLLLVLAPGVVPAPVQAQTLAGAAFLKVLPGARQQGMGGGFAGVADDPYAVFANPGSAGFLREWQVSGNYTKWLTDVYQSTLVFGMRHRTPWSRDTRFSVAALYQGVPEFDSSDRTSAPASASDLLLVSSIGQRLHFLSSRLSLGISAKYLHSKLANFETGSWIFDAGMQYRIKQFSLFSPESLLPFGSFSAGLAVNQLGTPLRYVSTETPLPRAMKAGVSFLAGNHKEFRLHLTFDYAQVRDEKDSFHLGTEVSWHPLITFRAGYNSSPRLFNKFSFGISVGLNRPQMPMAGKQFTANAAMRLDMGMLRSDDLFADTYRGDLSYFPVGPEAFSVLQPAYGEEILSGDVTLAWEAARDPDLFDQITYYLLVDTSKASLRAVLHELARSPLSFGEIYKRADVELKSHLVGTSYNLRQLAGGNYYWSVVALDSDGHARTAEKDGHVVHRFSVPLPDLQITDLQFEYDRWITSDPYQGKILISLTNSGTRNAANVAVQLSDESPPFFTQIADLTPGNDDLRQILGEQLIPELAVGDTMTLEFPWHTLHAGKHTLVARLDPGNHIREYDEENNSRAGDFFTIPKGVLFTAETAVGMIFSEMTNDLPFVSDVCFDSSSSAIAGAYINHSQVLSPLAVLAQRLLANPEITVQLQGFIDPNSDEFDLHLADQRARAVRDTLIGLGVEAAQLQVLPGLSHLRRRNPKDPLDTRWVLQERRTVKILASDSAAAVLFKPVRFNDIEPVPVPIPFTSTITSVAPLLRSRLLLIANEFADSVAASIIDEDRRIASIRWEWPDSAHLTPNDDAWQDKQIQYHLIVEDSLGRRFRTAARTFTLTGKSLVREKKIAWPLEFGKTTPLFEFYWTNLFEHVNRMLEDDNIRMRFIGHACATGPEDVNMRLSRARAVAFERRFIEYVKKNYPDSYAKIRSRIDAPIGLGEAKPIAMERIDGSEIVLGDNNSPIGRKINRSIEVKFYMPSGVVGLGGK